MGLDWSREISFSGLRKKALRKPKDEYPSKTFMNMMVEDAQERSVKRVSLIVVPVVVAILLFMKFGIYDPYHRVYLKTQEFSRLTEEYAGLELKLKDYENVREVYRMYDAIRMTNDAADVAAIDALTLVHDYAMTVGHVYNLTLEHGTLTLMLSDTSLDKAGSLVSVLYQQPIVESVEVSSAGNNNEVRQTRVMMVIKLRSVAAAEAAQLAEEDAAQSSEG